MRKLFVLAASGLLEGNGVTSAQLTRLMLPIDAQERIIAWPRVDNPKGRGYSAPVL